MLPSLSTISDQVHAAIIETVNEQTGQPDGKISLECQFNPKEFTVKKTVKWDDAGDSPPGRNTPDLDFGGGQAATFDLTLLFDTTRETSGVSLSANKRDVRYYTNVLMMLTMMRNEGGKPLPPPPVRFSWGGFALFVAVVTEVSVAYKLFHPDGVPVRAEATVKFKQYDYTDDKNLYPKGMNPTTRTEARKTRVVQTGERLDLIAYEEYGNPAHWRYLAEVNGLLDPRALRPGQILSVPPLP